MTWAWFFYRIGNNITRIGRYIFRMCLEMNISYVSIDVHPLKVDIYGTLPNRLGNNFYSDYRCHHLIAVPSCALWPLIVDLFSLSCKTSYRQYREASKPRSREIGSYNGRIALTFYRTSAAVLPRCLSNFGTIEKFIPDPRGFESLPVLVVKRLRA